MAQGIIRLEDMPSVIPESELPSKIIVSNPGDRKVVITPEESGINEEQVFTSDCLPDEIPYKLLGMVQYLDGSYYPKYVANVVTSQELGLRGKEGAENSVEVINKIAFGLTWQQGMLEAKSVKKSDLNFFDYEKESISYWLASPGVYVNYSYYDFGPGAVRSGFAEAGFDLFDSDGFSYEDWLGVRSIMILDSKIQMDRHPLIEL